VPEEPSEATSVWLEDSRGESVEFVGDDPITVHSSEGAHTLRATSVFVEDDRLRGESLAGESVDIDVESVDWLSSRTPRRSAIIAGTTISLLTLVTVAALAGSGWEPDIICIPRSRCS
ncbi:MAG: hypothetical protein KC561_13155, partial [Myxococcales bacterium]|nr:hypothetical protein [Myxococcales bacterium]